MKTLPVKEVDGVLMVDAPVPNTAIRTSLSPDGCIVYEEGDEQLLPEQPVKTE